jgi:hypothetical protein
MSSPDNLIPPTPAPIQYSDTLQWGVGEGANCEGRRGANEWGVSRKLSGKLNSGRQTELVY